MSEGKISLRPRSEAASGTSGVEKNSNEPSKAADTKAAPGNTAAAKQSNQDIKTSEQPADEEIPEDFKLNIVPQDKLGTVLYSAGLVPRILELYQKSTAAHRIRRK